MLKLRVKCFGTTVNGITSFANMGNEVDTNIINLNNKIKSLDPSNVDFSQNSGFLLFNPVKKYFLKIQKEEPAITEIVKILSKEKDVLSRDNITLEIEISKLEEIIDKLEKECENGKEFKEEIKSTIDKLKAEDVDKSKIDYYEQNVLDQIEKKINDLTEMLVVKRQSILALKIICRNNSEIIRNIDRIKNVTINALNTAVIVAKSLYNQKIVLSKINKVNKETGDIINSTSNVLLNDGAKIYEKSVNNGKSQELEDAFNKVLNTISEIKETNNKSFPENELQIIELKKMEEPYESK